MQLALGKNINKDITQNVELFLFIYFLEILCSSGGSQNSPE